MKGFILFFCLLLSSASLVQADTIYVSQMAAGSDTGESLANAHSMTWFNTPANWGTGPGQIGPNTTVRFIGEITSPLLIAGSGTSGEGNRIVLDFAGGSMNAPSLSITDAQIKFRGHDFITVTNCHFSDNIQIGRLYDLNGAADNITISNCVFVGREGCTVDAVCHQYGTHTLIENNYFKNIMHGVFGDTVLNHDITIRGNIFSGGKTSAISYNQDIIRFGDAYNVLIAGNHLTVRKDVDPAYVSNPGGEPYHCDVIQFYMKGGGNAGNPRDWTIRYNLIELDTTNRYHRHWVHAQQMAGTFDIYANIFLGTHGGQLSGGLQLGDNLDPLFAAHIHGNTFITKDGPGEIIFFTKSSDSTVAATEQYTFTNNIVYSLTDFRFNGINRPLNFYKNNNLYYAVSPTTHGQGIINDLLAEETGSLNQAPLFASVTNNDYRLLPSSPAIDHGGTLAQMYGRALFGVAWPNVALTDRPYGLGYDIGAYEYTGEAAFADMDHDGDVDGYDLKLFADSYTAGTNIIPPETFARQYGF